MIPRVAADTLKGLAGGYPAVAVTGPRQSGKTSLVRAVFPDLPYVSLEDPDEREHAVDDPRGFLHRFPDGAVLDEVQRTPQLFSYLQGILDGDPTPGRFILTGSQQFGLLAGVTQTLAGRVALVELMPFTLDELTAVQRAPEDINSLLFKGLYPPVYDRDLDPGIWYANYLRTYVERDVRQLVNIQDLAAFQRFVRLCAGRSGQLLNYSALAADVGVTHNTVRSWISVLQASYIVFLLQPYHRNFNKRLVKSPKLYFHDTGLASWLLGIREPEQMATHPLRGALFENWVVTELLKHRFNQGLPSDLYFWRDQAGIEVDVLVERGDGLLPIEIKSGQTVTSDQFKGLRKWLALAGETAAGARLVYGGDTESVRFGVGVIPWRQAGRVLR